ncbi:hypothetical protein DXG01_010109 [Tephrocybe rancida]|nr:hypothetical protein DXG01_010109 [Tephrocybe rancida]
MAVTTVEETRRTGPPPYPADTNHPRPGRHAEYYLEEGNLVLLVSSRVLILLGLSSATDMMVCKVKDTLFKIWDGSFRRHSEFFKNTSSSLLDIDKGIEGSDDEHPLVVDNVEAADFEKLLWIVYPSAIGTFKAKTAQDWIAVLDLATRWKFKDIRELSIKELSKFDIDAIEKIELQQKYEVKRQWAWSAFNALCSRTNGLDVAEGRRLGVETVIDISAVRERLEKWGRKKPDEVRKAVAEVFQLELEGPPIVTSPK